MSCAPRMRAPMMRASKARLFSPGAWPSACPAHRTGAIISATTPNRPPPRDSGPAHFPRGGTAIGHHDAAHEDHLLHALGRQRGAAVGLRRGRRQGPRRARPLVPDDHRRRGAAAARRSSRTARRSTPTSWSADSRSARARTSRTPLRPRNAAFRPGATSAGRKRIEIMRRAADLISERQFEYAALMTFEVGKNRLESLGDVEEAADLLRYYSDEMEQNDGFVRPMGSLSEAEHTRSVLKPHGVWAVISPFNFPMALSGGPSAGRADRRQHRRPEAQLRRAAARLQVRRGAARRRRAGRRLQLRHRAGRDGRRRAPGEPGHRRHGLHRLVRGRHEAVQQLHHGTIPRPIITEMGGKNPAIVTASANLDEAAEGVMRSAFGFDGQKCSANARVYVDKRVRRRVRRQAGGAHEDDRRRRPDPARELDGPGHQRAARSTSSRGP